jgi:hypothetical protein
MFSKALARARKKAAVSDVNSSEIDKVISKSRKGRGIK